MLFVCRNIGVVSTLIRIPVWPIGQNWLNLFIFHIGCRKGCPAFPCNLCSSRNHCLHYRIVVIQLGDFYVVIISKCHLHLISQHLESLAAAFCILVFIWQKGDRDILFLPGVTVVIARTAACQHAAGQEDCHT